MLWKFESLKTWLAIFIILGLLINSDKFPGSLAVASFGVAPPKTFLLLNTILLVIQFLNHLRWIEVFLWPHSSWFHTSSYSDRTLEPFHKL